MNVIENLPPGWSWGEYEERHRVLADLPPRVRRRLATEWARRAAADARSVLHVYEDRYPGDSRPRRAIEAAEQVAMLQDRADAAARAADAAADADAADAADAAYAAYAAAADAARAADAAAYAAAAAAAVAAADAADARVAADAAHKRWRWLYVTFRHARGPEGLVFDSAWRTATAVALSRGIVAERAFDRMPILADALQDAGCDDAGLLQHLQQDSEEFTPADWTLWNLLNPGENP